MRIVVASFVLSMAVAPVLHAQTTGGYAPSNRPNPLHQTNNPFTLVLEKKTMQTLLDGTHITRTGQDTFLRDTLGRTRTERTPDSFPVSGTTVHLIAVDDVVAGRTFNWTEFSGPQVSSGAQAKEYSVHDDHPISLPSSMRTAPLRQTSTSGTETPGSNNVVQPVASPRSFPKPHQEDLGMKDIQGFPCKATRVTTVYPEGFFGNDRPITVTDEHCRSQELMRDLEATLTDPRSGTTTTTVITVSRGEPNAALFHPPSDYTERVDGAR